MKERLKIVRTSNNLSQKEFAERLGVKAGTVTSYECGYRVPNESIVTAIAKEFNVNKEWLMSGIGEMKAPITREKEIADIVGTLYKLDDESFKFKLISALAGMDEDRLKMFETFIAGVMANK